MGTKGTGEAQFSTNSTQISNAILWKVKHLIKNMSGIGFESMLPFMYVNLMKQILVLLI